MCAGNGERLLTGMAGLLANPMQKQRPGYNGFKMFIRFSKPNKQRPPVIDQCNHPRYQPARLYFFGDKATPAPLIFDFIKVVFTIGPIPVMLNNANDLGIQRSD